jgi:hypothetical protein
MDSQLSQDYSVDSRYRGLKQAEDNDAAKRFAKTFLQRKAKRDKLTIGTDLAQEDRFFVAGPGQSQYTFRNAFRG